MKPDRFKNLLRPLVPGAVLQARAARRFFLERTWYATHLGAYGSFAEAENDITRRGASAGYTLDHAAWLRERATLATHDYPVLYWLGRLMPAADPACLVDFGGSVGVSYYTFREYLDLPPGLIWLVCELPEAVALGERVRDARQARQLAFTDDPRCVAGASLVLASGVLQYLDATPADWLRGLGDLPRHLIVNKLPLSPARAFVTIENGGRGLYPCRVGHHASFLAEMRALGYRLLGEWKCLEHRMDIVLQPDLSFPYYRGFAFALM